MSEKQKRLFESGNELAAYAAKQINYHVMGYYPITPSTQIAEKLDIEANMKNMGKLMKSTMAELKDKADGSAVNKAVKEFLSGK